MRLFLSIISLVAVLTASELEITANKFYHKESEHKAVFSGNVIAKEGSSLIKASKLIVYLDDKNDATEYQAVGNVSFRIRGKDGKKDIKGRCEELRYLPNRDTYYLRRKVAIEDVINGRQVFGDEIVIDNKNNASLAKSLSKRPVKFVFKVKTKDDKKEAKKSKKKKSLKIKRKIRKKKKINKDNRR
jgi:lipopolysaccharide export system protein LptA